MEVFCADCTSQLATGDGIDTRECALCGATLCRHSARKSSLRDDGGPWVDAIVCKDWAPCMVRHGERAIR
jgi:hypothetical protein